MTNLFVGQFFTWDEVHRKVIPRSDHCYLRTPYKYHIIKFPLYDNAKLDVSNGTYSREKVTLTKCKYTNEFRLCLGVSVVTPGIDGVEQPQEVRRCKPFVYSGKTLLIMTDLEKKVQNEFARVKGLKGEHTTGWVKFIVGTEDRLYLYYPITKLKNVGLKRHANCMS